MFKIPYSLLPPKVLRRSSRIFLFVGEFIRPLFPFLKLHLKHANIDVDSRDYLSMCFLSSLIFFGFFGLFITMILYLAETGSPLLVGLSVSSIFTFFVFFQQLMYPKVHTMRRIKSIERNLLPALQNILVQLNSGVSLFHVLLNISKNEYGGVSTEFGSAVKEIQTGKPQLEALEEIGSANPSIFFRRAIWQIVNGMKSGADMVSVIGEIINSLAEEQVLQVQKYGGQLNPLAMFYMLVAVIMPSLGMTFLIIISSFINLSTFATKLIFWGLYGFVIFFQLMFLGIIKSKRPNLLGEE